MAVSEHAREFGGKPVHNFDPRVGIAGPDEITYRIQETSYDAGDFMESLQTFLSDRNAAKVRALVVGPWSYMSDVSSAETVNALIQNKERLPGLRALFLGDITYEEMEISWITQSDMAPLLAAFPALEEFRVRGGNALHFGVIRHDKLRSLAIESGGLPSGVVRDVCASRFPALEHLEFWLGADEYGGNTTAADLDPVLSGRQFPRLRSLGLRDSPEADEMAQAVVASAVVRQLEVLDLSLGNLGNAGAQALLNLPRDARLKKLDIHHHYVGAELLAQLQQMPFAIDASEQESDNQDDRYIAHSE